MKALSSVGKLLAFIMLMVYIIASAAYAGDTADTSASWKELYTAYIKELPMSTSQAALIYLDQDDIPELVLHRDGYDPDILLYIKDGQVCSGNLDCEPAGYSVFNATQIGMGAYMYSQYLEKDGLIYLNFCHGANGYYFIARLDNGSFTTEISFEAIDRAYDFQEMLGRMNALYNSNLPNNRFLEGDTFSSKTELESYINNFSDNAASQYQGLYQAVPYPEGSVSQVWSSPDEYSSVLGQVTSGQVMDILSENGYGWGQIAYNGAAGWVKLRDTRITGNYKVAAPTSGFVTPANYMIVNTEGEGLELRTAPTADAPTYGPMYDGTIVTVNAIQGSWAYVDNKGVNGWAHMNYMQYYGSAGSGTNLSSNNNNDILDQIVGQWYLFGSDFEPGEYSKNVYATFYEDGYLDIKGTSYHYELSNQYPGFNIVATNTSGNGNHTLLLQYDPSDPEWIIMNTPPQNGVYAANAHIGRYPSASSYQHGF